MVADKIFDRMREIGMTQKEFSKKSGIPESTISDWKHKGTSPSADKLMIICTTLQVSPYYLFGESENADISSDCYVIDKDSDLGLLIETTSNMDSSMINRMIGFAMALKK